MAGGQEIGVAYVSLTVSAKGIADDIRKELGVVPQEAEKVGKEAGKKTGSNFASGLKDQIKDIGKGIAAAFAVTEVIGFFKNSINAASDLNETMSKSATVFGTSADAVSAWGDTAATAMGLSKEEAVNAASTFGNLFKQLGLGSDVAADMSTTMVQLASDFASFHNANPVEVTEAMTAAFRGEYDALQRFVPTINAAAVEQEAMAETGKKNADQLTAQEKAVATYTLVMQGAGDAVGDFARTSDSWANQQRILGAQWKDMSASIGQAFLPAVSGAAAVISNNLMPLITTLGVGLGTLVTGFAALPGPIQAATVALVAFAVAGKVGWISNLISGLQTIALHAMYLRDNIKLAASGTAGFATVAQNAFGRVKTAASGLVGALGGPWGIAIAAGIGIIIAAVSYFNSKNQEAERQAKAASEAIKTIGTAAKESGSWLSEATRGEAFKALTETKWGDNTGFIGFMKSVGIESKDMVDDLTGVEGASDKVTAAFERERAALQGKLDAAVVSGNRGLIGQYQEQLTVMDEQWSAYGLLRGAKEADAKASEEAAAATNASANAADLAAQSFKVAADGSLELAKGQEDQAAASKISITDNTALAQAMRAVGVEAKAASTELEGFKYIIDELSGRSRDAEQAQASWNKAIADAGKSVQETGQLTGEARDALASWNVDLLTGTAAGRDYYSTLDGLSTTFPNVVAGAYTAKSATGDLAGAQEAARSAATDLHGEFMTLAQGMGLNETEAAALATKLGILDGTQLTDKDFEIIAQAGGAERALHDVQMATIDGKTVYIDSQTGKYYADIAALQAGRVQKDVEINAALDPAIGQVEGWVPPPPGAPTPVDATTAPATSTVAGWKPPGLQPVPLTADMHAVVDSVISFTPPGRVVAITADLGPAQSVVAGWTPMQRIVKVDADISPAIGKVNGWTPTQRIVAVDANLSPAISAVNGWTPMMRIVKIDADLSPAIADVNGWTPLQRMVKVDADISPAVGVISRWSPAEKTMNVNASVNDSAVRNYVPPEKTMVVRQQVVPGGHLGGAIEDIRGYMAGGATPNIGPSNIDNTMIAVHRGEHVLDSGDVTALGGQAAVYAFRRALHSSFRPEPTGKTKPVVQMQVYQQPGASAADLTKEIDRRLAFVGVTGG